jgi:16S rRNA (guanine(966)-N(2))-methyltransferase RsmD
VRVPSQAQNYKLWSPQDMNTRPMMAAVRGAVFSMVTSLAHGNGQTAGSFPAGMRWLDLFAGTGAVGIEAVSRGISAAHYVELDPWVIANCLQRNLVHTRTDAASTVHNMTVQAFIAGAATSLRAAGGKPFDFVSVCPPYEKVSYPDLLASLEASPLVVAGTLLVVEYPKYESKCITDRIGRLEKIRDRNYGRTLVALYECLGPDGSTPRREAAAVAEAEYDAEQAAGSEDDDGEYDEEEEEEEGSDAAALGR